MDEINNNLRKEIIKDLNNNVIDSLIGWKEFPNGETYETTMIKYFDMWLVESEHPEFKKKILKTPKCALDHIIKMSDIKNDQLDLCFSDDSEHKGDFINIYGYVWDYLPWER